MGTPVRVGVVGVGHLGQHHARVYAGLPAVRLVGVADVDASRRAEVGARFGVPAHADHRELLGRVDAVSVAVPARHHAAVAADLLAGGVDVLLEKPIAEAVEEAEGLVRLAAAHHRILQVGHIERFNGAVRALRKLVTAPAFVEAHRLGPYAGRGSDVDVILDLMIHDIDIILSLVRSPLQDVHAVGVPVLTDQVDIANARLQFASGCVANLTASRVSAARMRKIRFFQRDAYLSVDYAAQEIALYRRLPPDPAPGDGTGLPRIVREEVLVERAEPLRLELESFLACVRERRRPIVSGEDGRDALRVAAEIRRRLEEHLAAAARPPGPAIPEGPAG
ncbi:MAG TPA: Gfo/Idh/MocA family oxidoreductase [Candidatus Sulfotelmatobacter sp.]|nr:Gfo/Idh/MocA family oxidoreductase [Candidatus Sulfotelmatobacter sp.]